MLMRHQVGDGSFVYFLSSWTIVAPRVTVIMTAIAVITMVMTIAAAIMIVVASVFAMSGVSSLFGFFGVGVSICHLYQLANGGTV